LLVADQQNSVSQSLTFNNVSFKSFQAGYECFACLNIITNRDCWSSINNREQKTEQSTNNKSVIKASQRQALARTDARSVHAVLVSPRERRFFYVRAKKKKKDRRTRLCLKMNIVEYNFTGIPAIETQIFNFQYKT
jgi:hypothetical protein